MSGFEMRRNAGDPASGGDGLPPLMTAKADRETDARPEDDENSGECGKGPPGWSRSTDGFKTKTFETELGFLKGHR
jgi:hypothetical protein